MKSVVIVCLYDKYGEEVATHLADIIDFHFLNVEQMIEYEIMDRVETQKRCGIEYLQKKEESVLKRVAEFETTVFYTNYDIFLNGIKKEFFNDKIIVYVKLTEKDLNHQLSCDYSQNANGELVINVISYNERDKFLLANASKTICTGGKTPLDIATSLIDKIKTEKCV